MPARGWQRLSAGEGAKGPRLYDWAYLPYRRGAAAGWEKGLLIRRKLDEPDELAFYLTLAPARPASPTLVRVAGTRWTIEACFEAAKGEVGLDEYEVRSWTGWHRHVTLAMLAHAYLAVVREAAVGGRGAARPRRRAAAADRAGGAPAALAPGLGAAARSRRRRSPGRAGADATSSAPAAATGDAEPARVNLGCSTSRSTVSSNRPNRSVARSLPPTVKGSTTAGTPICCATNSEARGSS